MGVGGWGWQGAYGGPYKALHNEADSKGSEALHNEADSKGSEARGAWGANEWGAMGPGAMDHECVRGKG